MLRTKFDPQESTFVKKFQVGYVVFPTANIELSFKQAHLYQNI